MKKRRKMILNFIISILCLIIFFQAFFPDLSMKIIGFRNYVVVSNSMDPKIKVNDMIIVKRVDPKNLAKGDIITFYAYLPTTNEDSLGNPIYERFAITHYLGDVLTVENEVIYKTYGIKNNPDLSYDQWKDENGQDTDIKAEDIIGRVIWIIPKIGVVSIFLFTLFRNPILLVLIIVNIVIIYAIYLLIKKQKKGVKNGME